MQRIKKYTEEIFTTGYLDYQGKYILLKRRFINNTNTIEWFISHYGLMASTPTWVDDFVQHFMDMDGYKNLKPDNFENDYQKVIRKEKLERLCGLK